MAAVNVDVRCRLGGRSSPCHSRNLRRNALTSSKCLVAPSGLARHHKELPQARRSGQPSRTLHCVSASSSSAAAPVPRRSCCAPASLESTAPGRSWGPQAARRAAAPALAQASRRESPGDEEGLEYTWRSDNGSGSDSDSDREIRSRPRSNGNGSVVHEDFLEGRQSLKRAMNGRVDSSLRSLVR